MTGLSISILINVALLGVVFYLALRLTEYTDLDKERAEIKKEAELLRSEYLLYLARQTQEYMGKQVELAQDVLKYCQKFRSLTCTKDSDNS